MSFECGQQRVMRPSWRRLGSLALRRVLTNRMREYFTYGSVGGAGGNPGSYPAPNRYLPFEPVPWSFGALISQGSAVGELRRSLRLCALLQYERKHDIHILSAAWF